MAGPRQPTLLVMAKGKKNFTKAEIQERLEKEVQPRTDEIAAPRFLTAAQRKRFDTLARQLEKLRIMGETDCETLARYVVAQFQYEDATKELRKLNRERPNMDTDPEYFPHMELWVAMVDAATRRQERYCKQASTLARDLGLTITSRCKLVAPKPKEDEPKRNKFAQLTPAAGGDE